MGDPFEFRWGPDRLAGLGVDLSPDQVACTQTPGTALLVQPLWEPLFMCDCGDLHRMWDGDTPAVKPAILDVVLDGEVVKREGHHTISYRRQDEIDSNYGDDTWRKYGKVVGEEEGITSFQEMHDYYLNNGETTWALWDAVMVDPQTAKRFLEQSRLAYQDTDLPALEYWTDLVQQINDGNFPVSDQEGVDELMGAGWEKVCADLRISAALDETGPVESPNWQTLNLVPNWDVLDPDLKRLWFDLVAGSKRSWSEWCSATGTTPQAAWYTARLSSPWT